MKIKKLAAVCKTYKLAYIFEDVRVMEDGTEIVKQWVSTGMSAYPLLNMPRLNKESLLAVFDIPENQWQDWIVQIKPMPKEMNLTEYDEEEYQIEWFFSPIIYNGEPLRCLGTEEDGILFLKESLLQPVDCQDTPGFFERRLPDGFPYIVVKDGIMVQGVVMPYDIYHIPEAGQRFAEQVRTFANKCGREVYNRERLEREKLIRQKEETT